MNRAVLVASGTLLLVTAFTVSPESILAQQAPSFKTGVEYVEVDALVTDANGTFISGLKAEDFQVSEDRKPQTIAAFSAVDIPIPTPRTGSLGGPSAGVESDTATNERPFDGRVYALVIDDLHLDLSNGPRASIVARRFIEEHLGARDLMAIVHTAGRTSASQELTGNRQLLLAAAGATDGQKGRSPEVVGAVEPVTDPSTLPQGDTRASVEPRVNKQNSLDTIRDVVRWLSDITGHRKTVLVLSEGIDIDPGADPGMLETVRDTIAMASRANVGVYDIDPRGLTLDGAAIESASNQNPGRGAGGLQGFQGSTVPGLRYLAEETGGFAVLNTNDFATPFSRVVLDNSQYYVLGYIPASSPPGTSHVIDVRVTRTGLTVRARRGYSTSKAPAATTRRVVDPPTGAPGLMTVEAQTAFKSSVPVSGLSIHMFAAPFRGSGRNGSVLLGIDIGGRDLRLQQSDKLVISYAAIDLNGRPQGGKTEALSMNLQSATKNRVEATGFRIVRRLELPPGQYQVRVVGHDTGGGRVGSVLYDVVVPDFHKDALAISGLLLVDGSQDVTVPWDDRLKVVLQAAPTAKRTFSADDELTLFSEVYTATGSSAPDVAATVTAENGDVVFKADSLKETADAQAKGAHHYILDIPLEGLKPGRYILTASARSAPTNGATVMRQVPFTVAMP